MYEYCIFDHEHKLFTYDKPKNTFVVDNSNEYPVKVTTNVTGNTSWADIFKGNYDYVNSDGTPQYLDVNGKKYTYIDAKWAINRMGYKFESLKSGQIATKWKSKTQKRIENFCKNIL